jgi:mannose/cellobiose epimerase-like protein (N-acyl-D-glucosamine 2-epimerase family)
MTDDIFEDRFHFCALLAYVEIATATGQSPPDSEATRRRAYQLYEEHLAEKNGRPRPRASRAT